MPPVEASEFNQLIEDHKKLVTELVLLVNGYSVNTLANGLQMVLAAVDDGKLNQILAVRAQLANQPEPLSIYEGAKDMAQNWQAIQVLRTAPEYRALKLGVPLRYLLPRHAPLFEVGAEGVSMALALHEQLVGKLRVVCPLPAGLLELVQKWFI